MSRSASSTDARLLSRSAQLCIAAGATCVHAALYLLPNHLPVFPPRSLPMTWLDLSIPFVPVTVFVYLSDYLLAFLAFLSCRAVSRARRFLWAFMSCVVLATLVHWLFPTVYPREQFPVPAETDGLSTLALVVLRTFDSPNSCLPSLHVATSLLSALAVQATHPRRFWAFLAWAVAVAASTLTAKQHYAIDVVAGAALAVSVMAVVERLSRSPRGMPLWSRLQATRSSGAAGSGAPHGW